MRVENRNSDHHLHELTCQPHLRNARAKCTCPSPPHTTVTFVLPQTIEEMWHSPGPTPPDPQRTKTQASQITRAGQGGQEQMTDCRHRGRDGGAKRTAGAVCPRRVRRNGRTEGREGTNL